MVLWKPEMDFNGTQSQVPETKWTELNEWTERWIELSFILILYSIQMKPKSDFVLVLAFIDFDWFWVGLNLIVFIEQNNFIRVYSLS